MTGDLAALADRFVDAGSVALWLSVPPAAFTGIVARMRKLRLVLMGTVVFAGGIAAGLGLAREKPAPEAALKVAFENARVAVREVTMVPGARRPPRTRSTDELVFFCEEARYTAIDAQGKTAPRDRRPGTVVWHGKGETAPTLVNTSERTVRYFSVSLK